MSTRAMFGWLDALVIACLLMHGCGKAKATNPAEAIAVNGPAGVDCYAILNSEGVAVGGNCLPH